MDSNNPSQPPPVYMPPPGGRGMDNFGNYGTGYNPSIQPYPAQPGMGYGQPPTAPVAATAPVTYSSGTTYGYADRDHSENFISEESGIPKSELGFDDKTIRRGFIRKVFFIIFVQLLVVCAFISIFLFVDSAKLFVQRHSWIYYIAYGFFLVSYLTIVCCQSVARKVPGNYIFLIILTLSLSYMTAMISSFYDTKIVILALGISAACSFCIIIFSLQTKFDFTKYIAVVAVVGFVIFFFGLFAIIFSVFLHIKILYLVYAGLAALLFMVYLAIDIQMLMGNKKYSLDPEDYVYAATQIFVDLVYIFLFILQLIGGSSSNKNGDNNSSGESTSLIRN